MNKFNNLITKQNSKQSFGFHDSPKEFNAGFIPDRSGTWRIEIDSAIEEVSQFSSAIQVLGLATEDDRVEIYLQTNGGSVDAGGAFINAILGCRAPIMCVASGGVHSFGTQILLACDSFQLADNFNSLIHNGSAGSYGNMNEYHAKSDFDKKFISKQLHKAYEGFLSFDEIEGVLRGDNIWLDAEGWVVRHEARNKHFQAKRAEESCGDDSCRSCITPESIGSSSFTDISEEELAAVIAANKRNFSADKPKKAKNAPK